MAFIKFTINFTKTFNMKKTSYVFLLLVFFFLACTRFNTWNKDTKSYGYVPIYANKNSVISIDILNPKTTVNPGKIYAYGNYIFQNDIGEGIHVIDNTNKQNPIKIKFIAIPYSNEIAMKDSILYSNNLTDLVVFDLSNPVNPKLINRVKNVFPEFSKKYPNEQDVYFECADTSKGVVVGWKKQTTINKTCYR